jgi:hypothetical protein
MNDEGQSATSRRARRYVRPNKRVAEMTPQEREAYIDHFTGELMNSINGRSDSPASPPSSARTYARPPDEWDSDEVLEQWAETFLTEVSRRSGRLKEPPDG